MTEKTRPNLITSVSMETRLFRKPKQIGETIENRDGELLLIIGIERFEVRHDTIKVWYTVQRLEITEFVSKGKLYRPPHTVELEAKAKHDDLNIRTLIPGRTVHVHGEAYKIMEYTEIDLKSTDLYISMLAYPIYPIDRKEAKTKLMDAKRQKLKFEVI
ncbi:hypothetical protein [Paenibacillus donghaensis]|uniref:Uncharacterized protein n=1 Tax=Paenibacillus donghaensis TaxID=414771 RepID=A0A2Z2KF26_9BACL|nr:hypothetical protein [Paenibacillus donghaensis]ASA25406.1 hypothetical protein B9T62_34535 [Paenibacillus donghaensis]